MPHTATAILTIANGGTISGKVGDAWGAGLHAGRVALDHASAVTIRAPATLTGAVSVEVAHIRNPATGDFAALLDDTGAAITLTAGKSRIIDVPGATDLRLVSAAAEGAARTFYVTIQENI